jgi:two-component system response regulator RegX3
MRELVARVRAVLRRLAAASEAEDASVIEKSGIRLDVDRHEVAANGKMVVLSPKEFALLAYMMRHSGRVRTREEILQAVWGEDNLLDERTVDVHIRWLRMKIEQAPAHPRALLTVRGIGYKFVDLR